MDNFEKAEQRGRQLFDTFCNNQDWCKVNRYSTTKFASYDVSFTSGDTKMIGEIKFREYPSTAFDNWYIKQSKIRGLERMKRITDTKLSPDENESQIAYILFFTDGVVRIWNVTNLTKEQEPVLTIVTNTTMGNDDLVERNQYLLFNNLTVYKGKYE